MNTNIVAPDNTSSIAYKVRDFLRKQRYDAMLNPYAARRKKMALSASLMLLVLAGVGIYSAVLLSDTPVEPDQGNAIRVDAPEIVKDGVAISGNVYCEDRGKQRYYMNDVEVTITKGNGETEQIRTSSDPVGGEGYFIFTNITSAAGPFEVTAKLNDKTLKLTNGKSYGNLASAFSAKNCNNSNGLLCDAVSGSVCNKDKTSYRGCAMNPGVHTRFDFAFTGCDPKPGETTVKNTPKPTLVETQNAISGNLWLDKNADGIRQKSENNLANIKVNLLNSKLDKVASTVTDKGGDYQFDDLDKGNYFVEIIIKDTKYNLSVSGRGSDECTDSNIDKSSGKSFVLTLSGDKDIDCIDAGLINVQQVDVPTPTTEPTLKPTTKPTSTPAPTKVQPTKISKPKATEYLTPTSTLSPTVVPSMIEIPSTNVDSSYQLICSADSLTTNYQLTYQALTSETIKLVYRFDSKIDTSSLSVSNISDGGEYQDGVVSWDAIDVEKGNIIELSFEVGVESNGYGQYINTVEITGDETNIIDSLGFTALCLPSTGVADSRILQISIALLITSGAFVALAMGVDEKIALVLNKHTTLGLKARKDQYEETIID